jgi:hypothetical protein
VGCFYFRWVDNYLRASNVGRVGHGAELPDVFGDRLDVDWMVLVDIRGIVEVL